MMKWFAKDESNKVRIGRRSDHKFPYAVEVARTKEAIESFIQEQLNPEVKENAEPSSSNVTEETGSSNSDTKEEAELYMCVLKQRITTAYQIPQDEEFPQRSMGQATIKEAKQRLHPRPSRGQFQTMVHVLTTVD